MRVSLKLGLSSLLWLDCALAFNHRAIHAFKRVENKRRAPQAIPVVPERSPLEKRASPFLNPNTEKFVVNGTAIPDVHFDIGESFAGLLPISESPDETRQLFFWFFPSSNPAATDEIAVWFNGGPGCSSLSGLLTENGPFLWESGTFLPTPNAYSWTNLTNVMWIEQPVGVGFTQGTPNITNEVELAQEFLGFFKNFVNAFNMHGFKVFLTGESYGGFYVPYIADAFVEANDTDFFNLKGVAINDPIIGDGTNQQEATIVPFVEFWSNLLNINETAMDALREAHTSCGYEAYVNEHLTFPPPAGPFPVLNPRGRQCDTFDGAFDAALTVNPCFNIYHITDTCPHLFDVLGIINQGDYFPPGAQVFFNRTDVQAAINAPVGTNWMQCTDKNVFNFGFVNNFTLGDTSDGPAQNGVLQRVIEATNNVFIGSGDLDFILNTNGTLLAIQNMTWNGVQGLQNPPTEPLFVPFHPEFNGGSLAGSGNSGTWVSERGLTFYKVPLSGHELPGYAPGVGYRMVEVMLGRVSNLSEVSDFTTQSGNFGN